MGGRVPKQSRHHAMFAMGASNLGIVGPLFAPHGVEPYGGKYEEMLIHMAGPAIQLPAPREGVGTKKRQPYHVIRTRKIVSCFRYRVANAISRPT